MIGGKGKRMMDELKSAWKFRLYTWKNLPSMAFWRSRVESITPEECVIALPYSFWSKNPFQSIYFAAMMGAGEMSTGLLAMIHLADRGKWSMLVTKVESDFYIKSSGELRFICNQGLQLVEKLDSIESSGKPDTFTMESKGKNAEDQVAVIIKVTWSFKKKAN